MEKAHLLICDDDPGIREALKLILDELYRLTIVTNGQEAINWLKTNPDPDLIVMDVKMPILNGIEALRQMRRVRPQVPVLMITGYESSDVAREAADFGADCYITKPFLKNKLLTEVENLLRLRQSPH